MENGKSAKLKNAENVRKDKSICKITLFSGEKLLKFYYGLTSKIVFSCKYVFLIDSSRVFPLFPLFREFPCIKQQKTDFLEIKNKTANFVVCPINILFEIFLDTKSKAKYIY